MRVVAYTGDDDLESREAWNTAKHDEGVSGVSAGISTFRWSSLRQKLTVVMTLYKRLWDWQKVKASLVELYGPGEGGHRSVGVRRQRIHLTRIDTESEHTGWRKPNKERQETLKNIFLGGKYGLSVSNGVQILEKESGLGQKIIDGGVSTVAALKACAAEPHFSLPLSPLQYNARCDASTGENH